MRPTGDSPSVVFNSPAPICIFQIRLMTVRLSLATLSFNLKHSHCVICIDRE